MGSSQLKFEYLGDIAKLVFRSRRGKTSVDFTGEDVSVTVNEQTVLKADSKKVFMPHIKTNKISDLGGGIMIGDVNIEDNGIELNSVSLSPGIEEKLTTFKIDAKHLVGNRKGSVGNSKGAVLLPSPGKEYLIELISAVLIYRFKEAAYTEGDDDVKIKSGNSEISGPTAAKDLIGAKGNKILLITPMSGFGAPLELGEGLSLCGTAYKNPNKAKGDVVGYISYRLVKIVS